jgi:hypothetical protein
MPRPEFLSESCLVDCILTKYSVMDLMWGRSGRRRKRVRAKFVEWCGNPNDSDNVVGDAGAVYASATDFVFLTSVARKFVANVSESQQKRRDTVSSGMTTIPSPQLEGCTLTNKAPGSFVCCNIKGNGGNRAAVRSTQEIRYPVMQKLTTFSKEHFGNWHENA